MNTWKLIVAGACLLQGPLFVRAEGEHIWSLRFIPDTNVEYKFRKEPLEEVITKITKRTGFNSVTFADEKLKKLTHSGSTGEVTAWQALVAILQKHQLDFEVREYELRIMPRDDRPVHYRFSPSMVCRFSQQPVGTMRPVSPSICRTTFAFFSSRG